MGYRPGKFRDAPFYTTSDTTTFGRRTAIYELPYDEKGVANSDMGRAARVFTINAIFLTHMVGGGIDALLAAASPAGFAAARDKLIKAVETPGPGQLVHPNFGSVMVVVKKDSLSVTHSTEDGADMCTVSFTCTESRDPLPPTGPGGLLDAADAVKEAAGSNFARIVTQGPDFLLQDVTSVLDSTLNTLRIANATITSVLEAPALLTSRIDAISRELASLLDTPRKLFDAIDAFLESLANSAGRVFDAAQQEDIPATLGASKITKNALVLVAPPSAASSALGIGNDVSAIPAALYETPTRTTQRENRAAIIASTKAALLANSAKALADVPPTSRTEALAVGKALAKAMVDLADSSVEGIETEATLYDTLKQLAAALQEYTELIAGQTANVLVHKTAYPIPVEVLAHRLYGDAERAYEILERNQHIVHGGMVPAQTELEVLDR